MAESKAKHYPVWAGNRALVDSQKKDRREKVESSQANTLKPLSDGIHAITDVGGHATKSIEGENSTDIPDSHAQDVNEREAGKKLKKKKISVPFILKEDLDKLGNVPERYINI